MDFLQEYKVFYKQLYPQRTFAATLTAVGTFLVPFFFLYTRNFRRSIVYSLISAILFYSLFILPPDAIYRIERGRREVYLQYTQPSRITSPPSWLSFGGSAILLCIQKLFTIFGDQTNDLTKDLACLALQQTIGNYEIRLYSPKVKIPSRKIIITNHVPKTFLDAVSFFPFCNKGAPMIVLQHNFNPIVTLISRWCWGGFTVDKEDKTPEGKKNMAERLGKLLQIMKNTQNLTVVIYAQGKVPKSQAELRNPGKFYPGAFYLSLMSGYPIVPLINDFDGIKLTTSYREPIYLQEECRERIVNSSNIVSFRELNRDLIEEQAERVKRIFEEEYEKNKKRESLIRQTKRGIYATGEVKG